MSDVLTEAVERFMDAVEERLRAMETAIRAFRVEPGPAGPQGESGPQGPAGEPGERGADGIAGISREDVEGLIEARFADLTVRTLADSYRDVFAAGEQYQRGDLVTHDGSLWIALADTEAQPGAGEGWKLCTKRGRDGRDRRA
jgi:hypothetical protein